MTLGSPSDSARIRVAGCDPDVWFRYTKVALGPGDTNPPFSNASAVATIFPSGDRDSADQIGGDLQPDVEIEEQRATSSIALRVEDEL
jgi:hypothetical protein